MNVESIHCRCFPQGHNSKDNISGSFIFQDLNDSYPVLAPIRKPGPRKKRGGDTIVIHGSQKTPPSVSTCDGEIEESEDDDEEEEEDEDDDEEGGYDEEEVGDDVDGEKEKMSGEKRDTPVPPRFTKALIWT